MPATQTPRRGPSIVVRGSAIHGKGVFATRAIAKGERIIEYKGTLITEEAADDRYGDDESNHTFLFLLERLRFHQRVGVLLWRFTWKKKKGLMGGGLAYIGRRTPVPALPARARS